jgi:hypothetical protein
MTPPVLPVPPVVPTPTPSPSQDTTKLERLILAQQEALERINRQYDDLSKKVNAPAPKAPQPPGAAFKEFTDDPMAKIREAIRESVAPLNDEITSLKAERVYGQLKSQYKTNPKVAKVWSSIEPHIDRVVLGAGAAAVTPQAVEAAISWAMGQVAMGNIEVPQDNGNGGAPALIDPPHMRPSTPARAPVNLEPEKKLRELSDNEEILRKRSGMTTEQWIAAADLKPSEVVRHDYRPKPKVEAK